MKWISEIDKINFKKIVDNPNKYKITNGDTTVVAKEVDNDGIFEVTDVNAEDLTPNIINSLRLNFSHENLDILKRVKNYQRGVMV